MTYSVKIAFQSLWNEKWINILSVLSIAMGMLLLAFVLIALYNIDYFTKSLPEKFSLVVYLKETLADEESRRISAELTQLDGVDKIRYISKSDALKELKNSLRDADYILEGLDENPLSASVEVKLKQRAMGPEAVREFAARVKKMQGVDDVQYGEKFLVTFQSIKIGLETIGLILAVIMTIGTIFICYTTVKILFYRKKEEIETLKLLGATRWFIRTPFMLEGGVIGMAGGIVSMIFALAFYYIVFFQLSATVPIARSVIFTPRMIMVLPAGGLLLGIVGSFIAVGKIGFKPE